MRAKKGAVDASRSSDGHIPRNIRLCLIVLDLVQPYAEILGFVDPARVSASTPALGFLAPGAAMQGGHVWLAWRVGGGFWIDDVGIECAEGDGRDWVSASKCGLGGGDAMSGKDLRDARAPQAAIAACTEREAAKMKPGEVCSVGGRVHSCAFLPDRSSQFLGTRADVSCQSASESARVCLHNRFLCAGLPAAWDGREGPRTYLTLLTISSPSPSPSARSMAPKLRLRGIGDGASAVFARSHDTLFSPSLPFPHSLPLSPPPSLSVSLSVSLSHSLSLSLFSLSRPPPSLPSLSFSLSLSLQIQFRK